MAFLSGWNAENRYGIQIDSSLIDSDLANFPVMIQPASAAFNKAMANYGQPCDGFETAYYTTSGDPPDTLLWTNDNLQGAYHGVYFGKYFFEGSGGNVNEITSYHSPYNISGDFDIQGKTLWTTLNAPDADYSWACKIAVKKVSDDAMIAEIGVGRTAAGAVSVYADGDDVSFQGYSESQQYGGLKITRASGVIKVFFYDEAADQWEWNASTAGLQVTDAETADVYFELWFEQENNGWVQSYFYDFRVPVGQVVWPDGPPADIPDRFTVCDPFTDADDELPNPDHWEEIENDSGYASIQSNKLNFTTVGGDVNVFGEYQSPYTLEGDFDIRVDFDVTSLGQPDDNMSLLGLFLRLASDDSEVGGMARIHNSAGSNGYGIWSGATSGGVITQADALGKIRIVRIGTDINSYYWDTTLQQWEWNGNTGGHDMATNGNPVKVVLKFEQENNGAMNVNFNDFVTQNGKPTWPQGTHPNRKKIAVTDADGTTELPVEIDVLDVDIPEAVYHTKVPSILAAADKIIYLYFDTDHAPNTTYIGDTGEAIAQSVWDSNFDGVWHLSQDPAAGDLLDSTDNERHMTAVNLEAADLLESPPGLGINFDGSNEMAYVNTTGVLTAYPATLETAGPVKSIGAAAHHNPSIGIGNSGVGTQQIAMNVYGALARVNFYSSSNNLIDATVSLAVDEFAHLATVLTDATDRVLFTNGADKQSDTDSDTWPTSVNRIAIGATADSSIGYRNGHISEARVSKIARSDAWVKATYHSLNNSLATYAIEGSLDFANRFEIEIDPDDIDATLTNFPLTLRLDSSSGLSSYDVTAIFDELAWTEVNDTFTGADDDPPNPDLWDVTQEVDPTIPWDIQNNELTHNFISGISGTGHIDSKFSISGDFDVQIDFTRSATPTTGFGLFFYMTDLALNNWIRIDIEGGVKYQQVSRINGGSTSADGSDGVSDSHTSGKFRITRVGNAVRSFRWDVDHWKSFANTITSSFLSVPFFVRLTSYDGNGSNGTYTYDNFVKNSGTVVWPLGTQNPNRQKIAVTLADGVTQCYVEIALWDNTAERATLFVKIPSISSTVKTTLFLYFDATALDNIVFVGDAGSANGNEVWDADFGVVLHMSDPTSNQVESTGIAGNTFTSVGTMLAGDLVDAEIDKGLDFDGSDDALEKRATGFDMVGLAEATAEVFFKAVSVKTTGFDTVAQNFTSGFGSIILDIHDKKLRGFYRITEVGFTPESVADVSTGVWHYGASAWESGSPVALFLDAATKVESANATGTLTKGAKAFDIAYNSLVASRLFEGNIDEVRFSKIRRSDAWITATRKTLIDELVTYEPAPAGGGTVYPVINNEVIFSGIFGGLIVR